MDNKLKRGLLLVGLILLIIGGTIYHERQKYAVQTQQTQQKMKQLQQQLQATKLELAIQKAKSHEAGIDDRTINHLSAKEQQFVQQLLYDNSFSGTILIVRRNHVLFQGGRGYANFATKQLNSPQTTYQIASIQKSLTAALLMKQVQAGNIDLATPLSRYYPQIKEADQITLKMMVDMHSGLTELSAPEKELSDQARIQYALDHLAVKDIGQHNYSPVNYLLLAGILEQVTHKSYRELVGNQLIIPFKLTSFNFMPNETTGQQATAYGYQQDGYGTPVSEPSYVYMRELGTGNMYATTSSLFRTEQAIVQGKVFKKSLLKTLRSSTTGEYTGGVYNYKDYFTSHGVESGFESSLQMSQDGRSGIVLLSNQYKANPSIGLLTNQLYKQLITLNR